MKVIARLARWVCRVAAAWPVRSQRLRFQVKAIDAALDFYLYDQREAEAAELIPEYLRLSREVYGGNPEGRVGAGYMGRRADLGVILWQSGRTERGLELFNESVRWFETHGCPDDRVWAACQFNIASGFARLKLNEQAVEWLEKTRTVRVRVHGPDSFEVGQCHNNVSIAYQELGQFDRAEAEGRKALAIYEKHPLKHQREMAMALNNLAETLRLAGRGDEALASAQRAVSLCQQDPEMLGAMLDTLADVYEHQDKLPLALAARGRALDQLASQNKNAKFAEYGGKQVALLERMGRTDDAARLRAGLADLKQREYFRYGAQEAQTR